MTGGTLTGALTIGGILRDSRLATGNTQMLNTDGTYIYAGNPATRLYLESNASPLVNLPGGVQTMYHTGNFDPATKINKAGDTLTGVLFHTRASITSGVGTNFRGQAFGNTSALLHCIRPIRTNEGLGGFSIYGAGLAWSTDDTHGYINVGYGGADAYIGGGNGNVINWTARLYHTGNIKDGQNSPDANAMAEGDIYLQW